MTLYVLLGCYEKKPSSLGTDGANSIPSSPQCSYPQSQKCVSPTDNLLIAFSFSIPLKLFEIAVPYGHLDISEPCFIMIEFQRTF